jgi:hypothetical protein
VWADNAVGTEAKLGGRATGAVVRTIGIVPGAKIGLMNLVDNMNSLVKLESRGEA